LGAVNTAVENGEVGESNTPLTVLPKAGEAPNKEPKPEASARGTAVAIDENENGEEKPLLALVLDE
jgi:hypothetical protein